MAGGDPACWGDSLSPGLWFFHKPWQGGTQLAGGIPYRPAYGFSINPRQGNPACWGDSLSPGLWLFHKSICAFRVPLIYRLLSVRSTHWYLFPSSLVFYNYIIIERQSQFVKQFLLAFFRFCRNPDSIFSPWLDHRQIPLLSIL